AAAAIGQPTPNGPRTPTISPARSRVSAEETAPTALTVWTSAPFLAGSPLKLMATSPTPMTCSILNCPGANPAAPASSSSSSSIVQMSGPTFCRRRMRARRGNIGSAVAAPGSVLWAIDIEHLHPCGLKPLDQNRHEPLHHVVAEIVVGFTFLPQT